jgi:hypothetical protein
MVAPFEEFSNYIEGSLAKGDQCTKINKYSA